MGHFTPCLFLNMELDLCHKKHMPWQFVTKGISERLMSAFIWAEQMNTQRFKGPEGKKKPKKTTKPQVVLDPGALFPASREDFLKQRFYFHHPAFPARKTTISISWANFSPLHGTPAAKKFRFSAFKSVRLLLIWDLLLRGATPTTLIDIKWGRKDTELWNFS